MIWGCLRRRGSRRDLARALVRARACVCVCMQCELKTKQTSKQAAVEGWAGLKKRGEWAIRGK